MKDTRVGVIGAGLRMHWAVTASCTVQDVADTIHAHPSLAEIPAGGGGKAAGGPFHV